MRRIGNYKGQPLRGWFYGADYRGAEAPRLTKDRRSAPGSASLDGRIAPGSASLDRLALRLYSAPDNWFRYKWFRFWFGAGYSVDNGQPLRGWFCGADYRGAEAPRLTKDRRSAPGSASLDGRIAPGSASLDGRIAPGSASLDGRIAPGSASLDGRIAPGSASLDGRIAPGSASVDGRFAPGFALLDGRVLRLYPAPDNWFRYNRFRFWFGAGYSVDNGQLYGADSVGLSMGGAIMGSWQPLRVCHNYVGSKRLARSAYPLLAGGLQPPGRKTKGTSPGGAVQYIDAQLYRAANF